MTVLYNLCAKVYQTTEPTDVDVIALRLGLYDAEVTHDTILGRTPDFRPLRLDPFVTFTDHSITIGISRTSHMRPEYYLTVHTTGKVYYSDGIDECMVPLLNCTYSDC